MTCVTIKPNDLIVKSLTALIKDAGNQFQVSMRDQKLDALCICKRIGAEGQGFATKTLPKFGKHFDSALREGKFLPIASFAKKPRAALPSFLNGLTRKVFALNGTLLDSPDTDAIRIIRQIAFMFYKLEGDYPQELIDEVIRGFVRTDEQVGEVNPFDHHHYIVAYTASKIVKRLFQDLDPRDIVPRPGPGVTACKTHTSKRYEPHVKYMNLHAVYPYSQYFYTNTRSLIRQLQVYKQLPVQLCGTSKLTVVPKDSRGPRIICTEPHEYMWFQQGLGRSMMDQLERHPLTRGHVNFTDQTINGRLALSSSKDGKFATLDMKDASDRIGMALVESLFDECPPLLRALQACTTDKVRLPDGRIVRKNKYASMGSALCFPVMSAVHFALAVAAIHVATGSKIKAIAKKVYVYGDDLIVDSSYVAHLMTTFPEFGLMFNQDKCFSKGKFRESCGIDAYNGVDVTPQRVKTHAVSRKDPASLEHFLAIFHGLFNRGLWETARVFQREIDREYPALPCVTKTSQAVGWIVPRSKILEAIRDRKVVYDDNYQTIAIWARVIRTLPDAVMYGSDQRLLRSFCHAKIESGNLTRRGQAKIVWTRIPLSAL